MKNLNDIDIQDHEFLVDQAGRSPYNLEMNYSVESEREEDQEGDGSIMIYYKNNRYSEPIEKRSHVVHALATNKPSMMRGFVIPSKYDKVRSFLNKMGYEIPQRED